jgi:hypothetical protein
LGGRICVGSEDYSLLVIGPAGTGKTVLALAAARRLAGEGKTVLVLCFTEPLGRWLAEQIGGLNPSVWAVKRYAVELLKQAGKDVTIEDTPAFWSGIAWQAVADALPKLNLPWDAVIVDESQDLSEDDWLLVEEISKDKFLWAFWDPDQSFWVDRPVREDLFKSRYRLQRPYRSPEAIRVLAGCYSGEIAQPQVLRQAVEQGVIGIKPCPTVASVPGQLAIELDKLCGSGFDPADIAILSLRGGAQPGSIVHSDRIGAHRIVRAQDPEAGSNIVAETFLRFKGLERPAIIITDLHLALDRENFNKRMYIALTRALSTVRVIDTRDSLLRDPVISGLCK